MQDRSGGPLHRALTRRVVLRAVGAGALAVPFTQLFGCDAPGSAGVDGGPRADASLTRDDGAVSVDGAMSDASTADASVADDAGATGWATGGTASMTDRDRYPNPFAGATGSACAVTCSATLGPCHITSPLRTDVSDGWDGLPMRLALRVVDESCVPVSDAIVEIWHTNYPGVYSGRIADICNTAAEDRAAGYFRGYLRTDAEGRVDFDSVFPGWYGGRAIHIHFRIMMGPYDGSDGAPAQVISQLFFDDVLVRSVFDSEPLYRDFGVPDTLNGADGVISGAADPSPYVCDIARMRDGAMQASKTIVLRTVSPSCRISG